jgi:hypothetical protein
MELFKTIENFLYHLNFALIIEPFIMVSRNGKNKAIAISPEEALFEARKHKLTLHFNYEVEILKIKSLAKESNITPKEILKIIESLKFDIWGLDGIVLPFISENLKTTFEKTLKSLEPEISQTDINKEFIEFGKALNEIRNSKLKELVNEVENLDPKSLNDLTGTYLEKRTGRKYSLQEFVDIILKDGEIGIEQTGIGVTEARKLSEKFEENQNEIIRSINNILSSNEGYKYPPKYSGKEFDYWLSKVSIGGLGYEVLEICISKLNSYIKEKSKVKKLELRNEETGEYDKHLLDFILKPGVEEGYNPEIESQTKGLSEKKPANKSKVLKECLEGYNFFALPIFKNISIDGKEKIISLIVNNKLPYNITFFHQVGFFDNILKEYSNHVKNEAFEIVRKILTPNRKSVREIRGNYNSLNPGSNEDKKRYTAHRHIERVKKDIEGLK